MTAGDVLTAAPFQPGLCSVSFRRLHVREVVDIAAANGLVGIEWGSDVHAPIGDLRQAEAIRQLCDEGGVTPASYGTYLRAGAGHASDHFMAIAETAAALGAANIRIWGGRQGIGSAQAADEDWVAATAEASALVAAAAPRGLSVSLEFHADTLVDTAPSARRFISGIASGAVYSYWQPTPGITLPAALDQLAQLAPHLSHVHVFARDAQRRRDLLASNADFWKPIFAVLEPTSPWPSARYAMIEFVLDDSVASLERDAACLHRLIAQ